jgi:protein-tyrosine kinase
MSIIERARGKLQWGRAKAAPADERIGAGQRPVLLERPVADLSGGTSSFGLTRQRRIPRESIEANAEHLRKEGMLVAEESAAVITDQFRRIKWPLLEFAASRDTAPANLIMVTSALPGEGKTFTSLNLALAIAREQDYSALLVDADATKSHITWLLGLDQRRGLTDLVADSALDPEELVLGTNWPGLAILPAGGRSSSTPELFASQRMIDVIRGLGGNDPRRIVLFDAAPLLATNESQVLAKIVDQIVLVVRAESTTQPTVLEAIGLLGANRRVSCVLNQARASRITEYYYGYGYNAHGQPAE